MIEIVSDSSTLYSSAQAEKAGFHSVPLNVILDKKSYRDFDDIDSVMMNQMCKTAKEISSSQPAIGEKIDLYNRLLADPDTTVMDICIADGLSGTYNSALSARMSCDDPERVTVINSAAVAGPHRAIVERAIELRDAGRSEEEIIEAIEAMKATDVSTVSVVDVNFLARGGRVSSGLASIGSFFKLIPTALRSDDGTTLSILGVNRTFKKVFGMVDRLFRKKGVSKGYTIYIIHADNEPAAAKAREYFSAAYPDCRIEVMPLNPMFMVHGGPGCLALEAVQTQF